jgi:hypothetical protein
MRPIVRGPGHLDSLVERRRRRLVAGGFPNALARELARDCATDLHALLDLVDRGCPPPLAARIMAPLDGEERSCS